MPRIAYVNGRYIAHAAAAVHVEDRGYQFADGVYEVCEIRDGRLIDEERHMARLDRSLGELRIRWPLSAGALGVILREVVARNRIADGIVYIQVTRGVAPRDHAFPRPEVRPGLVVTARALSREVRDKRAAEGVAVVTVPDNRWGRVDIKSIALLPNVLAKEAGRAAGAFEAWFVDGKGRVTEGTSTNAWIVTAEGALVTRQTDHGILAGITRAVLLDLLAGEGLRLEERAFSVSEAMTAREAFLTSASTAVTPVVRIDGKPVGDGRPGKIATGLRRAFLAAGTPPRRRKTAPKHDAASGLQRSANFDGDGRRLARHTAARGLVVDPRKATNALNRKKTEEATTRWRTAHKTFRTRS